MTTHEKIAQLASTGMTDDQISANMGITRAAVTKSRHKYGIQAGAVYRQERRDAGLAKLYAAGMSDAEIADKLDWTERGVAIRRRALQLHRSKSWGEYRATKVKVKRITAEETRATLKAKLATFRQAYIQPPDDQALLGRFMEMEAIGKVQL